MYSIGQTLTYKTLDEESYSRGYGIHYETKTSTVSEVRYQTDKHDEINSNKVEGTVSVGDTITYEVWDGEEGRGYGWAMIKKTAKVTGIVYKMQNGDRVYKNNIEESKGS